MFALTALTREQLDALSCPHPDDPTLAGELTLTPTCHTSALLVSYQDGVVSVFCAACHGLVAQIAVASSPELVH